MKQLALALGVFLATQSFAFAQNQNGGPTGRGSVTGDPAASTSNPSAEPRGTVGSSRSGSGTSTSGGRDDNGDRGRDKMPESDRNVRPDQPDRPK